MDQSSRSIGADIRSMQMDRLDTCSCSGRQIASKLAPVEESLFIGTYTNIDGALGSDAFTPQFKAALSFLGMPFRRFGTEDYLKLMTFKMLCNFNHRKKSETVSHVLCLVR